MSKKCIYCENKHHAKGLCKSHYTNLQSLWAKDNLAKGAKVEA